MGLTAAPMSMAPPAEIATGPGENTESYDRIVDNEFLAVADHPLSTFAIDVDTASYSNVRRFLTQGSLPPKDAVRIEELVNYFDYSYPDPDPSQPFSASTEVSESPWTKGNLIVHLGLQGKRMAATELPPRNLVFLLDVSGSMSHWNKLPLLVSALKLVVDTMTERDRVAIVVYAGSEGVVLEPTSGNRKTEILAALDSLSAGGSTNGGAGIQAAYALAERHFDRRAINRVILATDGDFNVGITDQDDLVRLIEDKRKSGVFLTVLGLGMGNVKDSTMEKLADKGNGNYAYIDSLAEARKVLVTEAGATMVTIAKDVKVQVEFNPAQVARYRLIGYENRLMAAHEFDDDSKDAGEIGAGHSVTALYEIVPAGPSAGELLTVKLRYKQPDGAASQLLAFPVDAEVRPLASSSDDFRFSAAVAAFGMLLRESPHKGTATWQMAHDLASRALGDDERGYRHEFLDLLDRASALARSTTAVAR